VPFSSPSIFGPGIGARFTGRFASGLTLGLQSLYYFGSNGSAPHGTTQSEWTLHATPEVGYELVFRTVTLRPYLGAGVALHGGSGWINKSDVYAEIVPGAELARWFNDVYIAVDAQVHVLAVGSGGTTGADGDALSFLASAGFAF
jgi:hypothetical protein